MKKQLPTIALVLFFGIVLVAASLPKDFTANLVPDLQNKDTGVPEPVTVPYGVPAIQIVTAVLWAIPVVYGILTWAKKSVPYKEDRQGHATTKDGYEIMITFRIMVEPIATGYGLLRSAALVNTAIDFVYAHMMAFFSERVEQRIELLSGGDRAKLNQIAREFTESPDYEAMDPLQFGVRLMFATVVDTNYDEAAEAAKRAQSSGDAAAIFTRGALGLPKDSKEPLSALQGLAGAAARFAMRGEAKEETPSRVNGGGE